MSESTSLEDFKKRLLANKINPILRVNADGRLYGVTFIDYQSRTILNGSKLGKEFSANVLNEFFPHKSLSSKSETINDSLSNGFAPSISFNDSVEFSLGLSLFEQHGEDWENESFVRREKLEQKKKRGRHL